MDAATLNPVAPLVALQFALHALGWAVGAWLLRDERRTLLNWSAFLALVGLGFLLMTGRDESRQWWAFNGAALCWCAGLLALWRGLASHFRVPPANRLQLGLAVLALASQTGVGAGLAHAPLRVVLTYGWMLLVVVLMVGSMLPQLRRERHRSTVAMIISPAVVIAIAFATLIVRQLLQPDQPLELHRFDPDNLRSLYSYLVAAAIFNLVFMVLVVGRLLARLRELGERDALTGLYNRRAMGDRLTEEWAAWTRDRVTFALVLVDLDHFKRINDTHGHLAGDEVLRQAAARLGSVVRRQDMTARIGGEEFVVLMPRASVHEATTLGLRVCAALAERPVQVPAADSGIAVTASVGVTQVLPGDRDTDAVLRRADQALYGAKAGGRARVQAAGTDGPAPVPASAPAETPPP